MGFVPRKEPKGPMTEVPSTVARSMGAAVGAAARLIEVCVDQAVTELQQAESQAAGEQRQKIADAWRELVARRGSWTRRFPQLLGAALQAEALGKPAPGAAPARHEGPALSLVDDTEIARNIESARLAQLLTSVLERPLSELDALMSSALGLPSVQPERNPLRPGVYAQVLRDMMAQDQPQPAWPGLWLRYMAKPLARELEQVYRSQAQFFTQQRVNAANYRLRASPSGPAPLGPMSRPAPLGPMSQPAPLGPASRPAPLGPMSQPAPLGPMSRPAPLGPMSQPAPLGPAAGPAPWGAASRPAPLGGGQAPQPTGPAPLAPGEAAEAEPPLHEVDAPRLQRFLLRGEPQAHRPLTRSYYARAERELRALEASDEEDPEYDERAVRQQMHVPPVDRPPRPVDTDSPLPEEIGGRYSAPRERALVHGRLKTQAREVGQVYGLEVVRRLVNRVADDPRLLGPVREAIVGLEPSLLRLAMVAPRFFSDEDHPGRLLVERVAERSFKFNDEFSVEFQGFLGPVAHGFQRLNAIDPLETAEPFRVVLQTLQAHWAAQDALDEEQQKKVLAAVQLVERRQQEADRIAIEFRQRPDLQGVPEAVREFLLGPWALVVAHARLTQTGSVDPGGHLAVVSDLLWSARSELTLHEPARAFELIPRVLLKLRAGLATLGQPPEESEAFFHQLETLHRPVMKLRAKKRHGEVARPEPPASVPAPAPDRAPDQPWMAAQELHVVGFEDKLPHEGAPGAGRATHAPAAALDEYEAEQLVHQLEPGCWVDLYARQQWRRAHLKWASEKRTLFMFVSHGGQPHSMTRRSIEKLVRERLLRPVDREAVVPRALAQLGQEPAQHAPA